MEKEKLKLMNSRVVFNLLAILPVQVFNIRIQNSILIMSKLHLIQNIDLLIFHIIPHFCLFQFFNFVDIQPL